MMMMKMSFQDELMSMMMNSHLLSSGIVIIIIIIESIFSIDVDDRNMPESKIRAAIGGHRVRTRSQ